MLAAAREEGSYRFEVNPTEFAQIPGSPFAYWCPHSILSSFARMKSVSDIATATVGLQSSDDFRFLRLWWETAGQAGFSPFAKGGQYGTFFADIYLQARWAEDGAEIKAFAETTPGSSHWSRNIRSADQYFRPGLTWPRRTNGLSLRVMPAGCIFADKGPAVFVEHDDEEALLALCAVMNSTSFNYLVGVQLARTELAQSFEVGLIQQTPVPTLGSSDQAILAEHARRIWSLRRRLASTEEVSRAFVLPQQLLQRASDFDPLAIQAEIHDLEVKIDELAYGAFGFTESDKKAMEAWRSASTSSLNSSDQSDDEGENDGVSDSDSGALLSWAVGAAFGRFDVRLATGERPIPTEPQPFDALPDKSPGMIEGEQNRLAICSGILVDDAGHVDDLVERVGNICERVGIDFTDENVRADIAQRFFSSHMKSYSKSRRKAPIYWQLAIPSLEYSIWLYAPGINKDTLVRLENDYLAPKLARERRQFELLRSEADSNQTTEARRAVEGQARLIDELKTILDEVKRAIPLWDPNLEDGAAINAAPLHRLFPSSKAWQKETTATWKELCRGDYDWSRLAMHLWPERVVPKCAVDRSIAIAHGLHNVFWVEDERGGWKASDKAKTLIPKLIRDRDSASVKAALKSLMDAPETGVASKRTRKSKAA